MVNLRKASRHESRLSSPAVEPIVAPLEEAGMLHSLQAFRPFRLLFMGTLATNSAF
jgi:hypothetical protein